MKNSVIAALVTVVALGGLGFYMLLTTPQHSPQTTTVTTQMQTATISQTTQTPRRISLTLYLNDYGYNASKGGPRITVYVGDVVSIRLIGNGSGPIVHDFTLDEGSPSPYSVKSERLRKGQEQVVEFVANREGVYTYYCSVKGFAGPSHRERGQEGTIEILPRT